MTTKKNIKKTDVLDSRYQGMQTNVHNSCDHLLKVNSLSVEYSTKEGALKALRDVSIEVGEGETVGIAGESGSGKSTLVYAILQSLDDNGYIANGSVLFTGTNIYDLTEKGMASIRGKQIAHIPQDPSTSLNPSIRVGEQVAETIRFNLGKSRSQAKREALDLLRKVGIADPEYNYERYPHELSGGMKQRILIAIALSCDPKLLILDEPTTGLDVTTQSKILELLKELKADLNTSIILITHNLRVISAIADRVNILYAGEVVERGSIDDVFQTPGNPYTQGMLAAIPKITEENELKPIPGKVPGLIDVPEGCIFADRCEFAEEECKADSIQLEGVNSNSEHLVRCRRWKTVQDSPIHAQSKRVDNRSMDTEPLIEAKHLRKHFSDSSYVERLLGNATPVQAVNGVDLTINRSETVGLVGESGCGKSTLGRLLINLLDHTDGEVRFEGKDLTEFSKQDLMDFRSKCQVVFQNPRSSLNPRKKVYDQIERPIIKFLDLDEEERNNRIMTLLDEVSLGESYAERYPHELSGGEQQRVAIARAFAPNPRFILLDEPVSALDVSVQASILNLLNKLGDKYDTSYLLISHDIGVVKYICDRIAIMYLGEIVESGRTEEIFEPPHHPYTRALLSSIPSPEPGSDKRSLHVEGEVPSPRNPPSGCSFHTRCPQYIGSECEKADPALNAVSDRSTHQISCHHDLEQLSAGLDDSENLSKREYTVRSVEETD